MSKGSADEESKGGNDDRNDEEDEKSRLPPPKNFLLTKHDKFTLEIEIGDHITFVQETLNGERDVAPPDKFLIHYLKYSRSKLPRFMLL